MKNIIVNICLKIIYWLNGSNSIAYMIAGEPSMPPGFFQGRSLDVRLAGEDLARDVMMVNVVDWAKWVEDGWKTDASLDRNDLIRVHNALGHYLNNTK